ncbi:MAG: dephospho-CoA kinase [Candidatus Deferrimicrobiaceae bacterium]
MRVFGLTGGIGSGKSTVARLFREEKIPVVDADRISREITSPGKPAYIEIVGRFGEEILLPDGRIDRKILGAIIFSNAGKRADLEAITHPRIAEGMREAVSALASEGHPVVIVEAALIHEKDPQGMFDAVIGVRCGRGLQIERLMRRDGIPREQALRIVSSQMDPEEKALTSDYVIDNSGDLAGTRAQVRALAKILRQAASGS